mgnify:CR=1 FL=1
MTVEPILQDLKKFIISEWADLAKHRYQILTDEEFLVRLDGRLTILRDRIQAEKQEGVH